MKARCGFLYLALCVIPTIGNAAQPDPSAAVGEIALPAGLRGACDPDPNAHGALSLSQLVLDLRYGADR